MLKNRDITKNQSQLHPKIKSLARDDTIFFTEVHLLSGKLVLVVAIHSLDGSRTNWQSKAKPSAGVAHRPTRWGSFKLPAIH